MALVVVLHVIVWLKGATHVLSGDAHDIWQEGVRIFQGQDPYARMLTGDMLHNDNYPTYLPLMYLFSAALNLLGIRSFEGFLAIWRPLSLVCHMGIGVLVYRAFRQRQTSMTGLVAAALVFFSRWSMYLVESAQLEFATIFSFMLAVALLARFPRRAGLLMGLSLSIKFIGILLLPLLLLRRERQTNAMADAHRPSPSSASFQRSSMLRLSFWVLLLPLLISLPFLIWNPGAFVESLAFSITRLPAGHPETGEAPVALFGLIGVRMLMGLLVALGWWLYAKGRLAFWSASCVCLLAYTQLNPVVFTQYYLWLLVAVLMALAEGLHPSPSGGSTDTDASARAGRSTSKELP